MYSLQPLDGSYVHTVLMTPILGNRFVLYELYILIIASLDM